MTAVSYIALGSNLGDRHAYLQRARDAIGALPGCQIVAASRVDETTPLGGLAQPSYLNQMLAVETTLEPLALLTHLQRIEAEAGRVRSARWASRTLDLDIVAIDGRTVCSPELTVPHPGLEDRDFWQRELADVRAQLARGDE